jgi:glycosyltransferase involved in cell wall biosynthesis
MWSVLPLTASCLRLVLLRVTRRIDVVHVNISGNGSTVRKAVVVAVCHLVRLPTVLHLHASGFEEFHDALPPPVRRVVRWVFRTPASVVVLGDGWRAFVCGALGVPADRVTVLPNAVPGPPHVTIRCRLATEPLEVLFLGRLGERKGVPELLDALADPRLAGRPWHATVAGDGDVERYRRHAARRGLSARVDLPGWVGPPEMRRLLARAHVLVLPSRAEGLPLSVLEAFAWGVPVVSTPVGSIPEVVTHGVDGLLVATGRPDLLAAALSALLGDEDWRVALAAEARRTWERTYAIGPYVERLTGLWRQVARVDRPDTVRTGEHERAVG